MGVFWGRSAFALRNVLSRRERASCFVFVQLAGGFGAFCCEANLYYGFTMDGDKAVCKEGYKSAQGFLDHLGNVDGPLKAALTVADITSIEVHGPQGEVDKLREPLKAFPVTYWNATPGAFYAPIQYGPPRASMLDDTVSVMVYWKVKNETAFLKGCDDFIALTKKEEACRSRAARTRRGSARQLIVVWGPFFAVLP